MRQWTINLLAVFTIATGAVFLANPTPADAGEVTCRADEGEVCKCTSGDGDVCMGDFCRADNDSCGTE